MLFVLTGASCSGKSQLTAALSGFPGLVVRDFDEHGVPQHPGNAWRQRKIERWVRLAIEAQYDGVDLLLSAPSPLGEVLAAPSADRLDGISVALVDVGDMQRKARLEERSPGVLSSRGRAGILDWARWYRGHGADPRFEPGRLTTAAANGMRWDRWMHWRAGDPRWATTVVNTTDVDLTTSTAEVSSWIRAGRRSRPRPLA